MINTEEKLLFEISTPGARAVDLPESDVPQLELVRHYTHLSHRTFSIDANFYPLGSCTMKYNPKVNEWAAALSGFANLHPDRKSTRLNSSHGYISYAVFCLKK